VPDKKQRDYAAAYYKRHRDAIREREKARRESMTASKKKERAARFETLKATMLDASRKLAEQSREGSTDGRPKPAA
jgi:hypothetical protein